MSGYNMEGIKQQLSGRGHSSRFVDFAPARESDWDNFDIEEVVLGLVKGIDDAGRTALMRLQGLERDDRKAALLAEMFADLFAMRAAGGMIAMLDEGKTIEEIINTMSPLFKQFENGLVDGKSED